jgi:hypothetical protein
MQWRVRKELDATVAMPATAANFPPVVLWGQKRGGISISLDKMTAIARFPTLHKRFDMVRAWQPWLWRLVLPLFFAGARVRGCAGARVRGCVCVMRGAWCEVCMVV